MNNDLLITFEILVVVVVPLLFLYLRSKWPLQTIIPSLMSIPILWYLTYALFHELSHVAGTYLAGGTVVDHKLIPRFWSGEFGRAWITPAGITQSWQQLISTCFPYLVDVICILAGMFILQRDFSKNAFVVGLVFMLLCLRPAFDFVCEPIAFLSGDRGDFYGIQMIVGSNITWLLISLGAVISLLSILGVLRRYMGFPATASTETRT